MLVRHDRCSATNTENRFFDVFHFQTCCLGKQTGDDLANLFTALSAGMLAGAREAAKKGNFLSWLDGPHLNVDFEVTIKIGSCSNAM